MTKNIYNRSELCSTRAEYIGYVYIVPTLCITATISNTFTLYVFTKHEFRRTIKSSILNFLTVLTVADGMAALLISPTGRVKCSKDNGNFWGHYELFVYSPIASSFGTISIWITLAIAFERCIFMKSSSAFQSVLMEYNQTICVLVPLIIVAFLVNMPYFFYGIVDNINYIKATRFAQSETYAVSYY